MSLPAAHRFRVIAQLGRGGMSEVYLAAAQGPGGFQKLMVLKVQKPDLALDHHFFRMFREEARLAARLNHPNIVQTYEVGELEGRSFIAMEYLEGQPLSQVAARLGPCGHLSVAFALRVVIGALEGLHYAHELADYDGRPLLVVHRDATPQNLFVTYQGQIKLVDFGIAKTLHSSSDTTVGTVKGKVSYMAPEQARGDPVDRRTDLFSLGVVLWELLSGRRLWEGLTDIAVIGRLVQGEVPDLGRVTRGLSPELIGLCMSALCPDPTVRPQTAFEFQVGLERELALLPDALTPRRLGEIVAESFAAERARVASVVSRQLERLIQEPITSVHPGAPRLPSAASTPMPILGVEGIVHDLPTSQHTLQGDEARSGRSATAVVAALRPSSHPPRSKPVYGVPARTLVASVLAVGALVAGSNYWFIGRQVNQRRHSERALAAAETRPLVTPVLEGGCSAREKPLVELSGDITEDARLDCSKDYLLKYTTSVQSGATLTIPPGTLLKGDRDTKGTLVIQPGGRIEASGTADRPIVLTSSAEPGQRRAGDWGGVIILGRAPTNHHDARGRPVRARIEGLTKGGEYGGTDPNDNSGTLRYVRIEYSGDEIAPNNEINGLSFGAVGRGTVVDHVLVRHTADDCFEFFGGTVDAKYLACLEAGDDAFDWDFGYTGRLQFLIGQASAEERSGSNGLEGDNHPAASRARPTSSPQVYNATLCGKNRQLSGEHYGLLLRRGTALELRNSIVMGFRAGLDVRDGGTSADVQNTTFFGNVWNNLAPDEVLSAEDKELADDDGGLDERALLTRRGGNNLDRDPHLRRCFDRSSPDFVPERSLEGLGVRPPADGFFDARANYPGAIENEAGNWLSGEWARLHD